MDNVVTIIIAVIASTGFWTFLGKLLDKKKALSPTDKMVLALGRDKLWHLGCKYINQGYMTTSEYEVFSKLYESYIDMGGNSVVKKIGEQALKLEVKHEDAD